jgi:hypothetical protein
MKYKKILVCYLFTKYDDKKSLINFVRNYKFNKSGVRHKLLICFKLLNNKDISSLKLSIKNIKYTEFNDDVTFNDYDFGSYKRVAQKYPSFIIFFFNSHSYPITKNWLKKLLVHYKSKTLIGTSASNESLLTSLKLKRVYKILSYLYKFFMYKNKFKPFPNPHIRTSSFLIRGSDFLKFVEKKEFNIKEDTWEAESGINGMTNFFKQNKFKIYIVNSDGYKFSENLWKYSETYNFDNQSKSLISDKHTRKYLKLTTKQRIFFQQNTWI